MSAEIYLQRPILASYVVSCMFALLLMPHELHLLLFSTYFFLVIGYGAPHFSLSLS